MSYYTIEEYAEMKRTGLYPDGCPIVCPDCGSDDCDATDPGIRKCQNIED